MICCLNSKKISITLRTRQLPFVSTSTLSGQHYESIWAIHSLRKSKKHPKTYFKWIKAQQGKQNRLLCRIELWWKRRVEVRNTLLLKTGKNLKTKTEDIAKEFFKKKTSRNHAKYWGQQQVNSLQYQSSAQWMLIKWQREKPDRASHLSRKQKPQVLQNLITLRLLRLLKESDTLHSA